MEDLIAELVTKVDNLADILSAKSAFYTIFIPFISALAGALSSALLFHRLAMKRENRQQVYKRTHEMIDQFYSKEFIGHRVALGRMRNQVLGSNVSIRYISYGYIYPINNKCYVGETSEGLTEHQHLTIFLGFIERLGLYIKNNQIDKVEIKAALSYKLRWKADLIRALAKDVKAIAQESSVEVPPFVDNVFLVLDALQLRSQHDVIQETHFPLKESEKVSELLILANTI